MGGSSKTSQNQQTSNTSLTQAYTDNSVTDIFTDNSQVTDIYQDLSDNSDRSQRTDIYQDLSDNSDRSQRTDIYQDLSDNSIREFEGQLSGANVGGNVTINTMADGAFDFGRDVVKELSGTAQSAINAGVEQTYLTTKAVQETAANALAFGDRAISSVENTSIKAMDRLLAGSETAIKSATDSTIFAGETIGNAAELFAKQNQATTAASIEAANSAMERNAALIQTTALGGQDLMIDAMKKVLMAGAAMMAVVFAVSAYKGAK